MAQSAELLKLKQAESLPPRPTLWSPWLADGLASSTLRLQRLGVQGQAQPTIVDLLRKMNLQVQFRAALLWMALPASTISSLCVGMEVRAAIQVESHATHLCR